MTEPRLNRCTTDELALDTIRAVLSGQEWDADTCQRVAEIVRETGRRVLDVDEASLDLPKYGQEPGR